MHNIDENNEFIYTQDFNINTSLVNKILNKLTNVWITDVGAVISFDEKKEI